MVWNNFLSAMPDKNTFLSCFVGYAYTIFKYISDKISKINGKAYLFLDEIQEVAAWEKCVNSLRAKFDCDIYITGSNAKLLSDEFATYLGGRYIEIVIYPFSFAEFIERSITDYFKSEKRDVAVETVLNYLQYSENAHLLSRVKRKDMIGKKTLSVNEKFYIADHGLREAVVGKNRQDISLILENIVFMELKRRGYNINVGKINGHEIDFVAEKNNAQVYVQVCYLLASNRTIEREFSVLEKIKDNFPKYVVSLDEFDMSRNGIKHCNVREFLLSDELGR